jgi:TPP-dependent 2-oxoacid decarboxylase
MKITIGSLLIDRLISLGVSRICGVPGDYNLEFLKFLAVYEIGWMLQICWREKRPA